MACRAAIHRWTRVRFGSPSFAALGLPGGAMVDAGLEDLAAGQVTVESLLVSLAAPRLRREGVPVPAETLSEPESRLWRLLSGTERGLAHARYLAHLRQMTSFTDSCRRVRRNRGRRAK